MTVNRRAGTRPRDKQIVRKPQIALQVPLSGEENQLRLAFPRHLIRLKIEMNNTVALSIRITAASVQHADVEQRRSLIGWNPHHRRQRLRRPCPRGRAGAPGTSSHGGRQDCPRGATGQAHQKRGDGPVRPRHRMAGRAGRLLGRDSPCRAGPRPRGRARSVRRGQ